MERAGWRVFLFKNFLRTFFIIKIYDKMKNGSCLGHIL